MNQPLTHRELPTLPLLPQPTCTLVEGAMKCEIDGVAGVGWTEFMWPTPYLEYLRGQ